MNSSTPPFALGPWNNLSGNTGSHFTMNENYIAGSEGIHLAVWADKKLMKEVMASTQVSGVPRIVGSRIYWGNGWFDLSTHQFYPIPHIESAYGVGTEFAESPSPAGFYKPYTFAWAPDGSFVLVTVNIAGKPGSQSSRALLIDKKATIKKVLWEGNEATPKSALVAKDKIILGTNPLRIYTWDGNLLQTLDNKFLPEKMEVNTEESILLIQSYDALHIWNTNSWEKTDTWEGPWLDASLAPSGDLLAAIDFEGKLHVATVKEKIQNKFLPSQPENFSTISLGDGQLVATFDKGVPIRISSLDKE